MLNFILFYFKTNLSIVRYHFTWNKPNIICLRSQWHELHNNITYNILFWYNLSGNISLKTIIIGVKFKKK